MLRSHPTFDPLTEPIRKRHLWLLLPGFPLQWWIKEILIRVINSVGKFVYVYERSLISDQKKLASILVEFNVTLRLLTELEILYSDSLHVQRLDY